MEKERETELETSVRVINQLHENARAGAVVGTLKVGDHQVSQYCLKLGMFGFFPLGGIFFIYLFINFYFYIYLLLFSTCNEVSSICGSHQSALWDFWYLPVLFGLCNLL